VKNPLRLVEHRVRHEDRRDREANWQWNRPAFAEDGLQADGHWQDENPEVVILHVGAEQRDAHDQQRPGERKAGVPGPRARREPHQRVEHAGVTRQGQHGGDAASNRILEERHQREMRAGVGRLHRPVAAHRRQHLERPVHTDDGRAQQVVRDGDGGCDAGRHPRP